MVKKTKAYVDTSAFIAFLDRSDTYHPIFYRLFSTPPSLLTSPLVVAEGHAWFLKRYDSYRALQFLSFIEDLKCLELLEVGPELLKKSYALLRRFSDQSLTLADASSLRLMEQHRIQQCWSTDFHLSLLGARLIIHE